MRDKFGLDFRIVDSSLMRDLRRRRGIHVNPWAHFPRLITSIDFLKRERPLRLFRETLPAPGEPIYPRKYDLLIVDEAHNCAPSGVGRYAADSLRTQALRVLVHYEIPWNPNRMEQRNGLVDRHGQKADKVLVYHFVGKGYEASGGRKSPVSSLEADLEFLMRVALKIETIREDLGKVGTVIAEQVEEAMLGRRTTLNTEKAEKDAEPIRKMLKFERDLQKQVQALMEQYRETRKELRLSPENIRRVVEVGLSLAGQPTLIPAKTQDGQPCFQLPPLKGSWADCAAGLEHPHTKEIRPITFDEAVARGRHDVVLVHLNHRLPQMCLRLLRAEVWAEKGRSKLQRVTARVVPNVRPVPEPARADGSVQYQLGAERPGACPAAAARVRPLARIVREAQGRSHPHHHWIKFVLTKTLDLDDRVLLEGQAIPQTLQVEVPEHHQLLRPSIVVNDPGTKKARLLICVYPRSQELTSYVAGSPRKASPDTRMTELLHGTGEVGLDQLTAAAFTIPRAVPSRPWPGTASLEVAHLWLRLGSWPGPFVLDDQPAPGITPYLTPTSAVTGKRRWRPTMPPAAWTC